MQAIGEFRVCEFTPVGEPPEIEVGLPAGHARMVKEFTGEIEGRSITQFSFVYDGERGGTYMATESFTGTVAGRVGALAFVHSATDRGDGVRTDQFFLIVPGSGSGELVGATGGGAIEIDDDGTHRLVLDLEVV